MSIFETPQWICWKFFENLKGGKPIKAPIDPITGSTMDHLNPANWMDYGTACATGHRVGFVFTPDDPFFLLDLDNCRDPDTGGWDAHAQYVAAMTAGAYQEISVSGKGLHIIGQCRDLLTDNKNRWRDADNREFEFYQTGRFVALGDVHTAVGDTDVDCTQALRGFVPLRDFDTSVPLPEGRDPEWRGPEDDDALITLMLSARTSAGAAFGGGPTLQDLWEGNADAISSKYPSENGDDFDHSGADGALMAHLAFYTGRDQERMDRLFRRSALMRDKYENRPDYRAATIQGAARVCKNVLKSPKYSRATTPPDDLPETTTAFARSLRARIQYAIDHEVGLPEGESLEVPEVDAGVLHQIITRTFWKAQGAQCYALKPDNNLVQFGRQTLKEQLKAIYGNPFAETEQETRKYLHDMLGAGQKTELNNALRVVAGLQWPKVVEYVERERQALSESHKVDLFCEDARVDVRDGVASVTLPWKPFETPRPVTDIDPHVVQEYKGHFPEFDEVLRFIVAARVADVRKASHLWLKAPSDWGKGLFINLFKPINAAVLTNPVEISRMVEGNPSGRTPGQFLRTLTLVIDEFKKVTSEIKTLDEDISFSPKNQLQVTVPLYSKLYFSAEHVGSLAGDSGVEDQFVNRFCFIEGRGKIDDLPYRSKVGQDYFDQHIRQYACNFINEEIENYRSMGRDNASHAGGKYVREFHAAHSIARHFGNLNDALGELAEQFKYFCIRQIHNRGEHVAMQDGVVYVRSPATVWEEFIDADFPRSERMMVKLKKEEVFKQGILGGLDSRGRPPVRRLPPEVWGPDTQTARCFSFPISDPTRGAFGNVIPLDNSTR